MNKVTALFVVILAIFLAGCATKAPVDTTSTTPVTVVPTTIEVVQTTVTPTTILVEEPTETGDKREYIEGSLISLNDIKAQDPDQDSLVYYYSEPFNAQGKWQTKIGDAGVYKIKVVASDGKLNATKEITIVVKSLNRAPIISVANEIHVKEGEKVSLNPIVSDPDGDVVIVSYKGWMSSSEYLTQYNDAGEHTVEILASDGKAVTTYDVKVVVENVNRAPVLEQFNYDIVVKEGEKVELTAKASDIDGDSVKTSFSKPLNEDGTWQTKIGDAGSYFVNVTATDGTSAVMEVVKVIVEALNNKPKLDVPSVINVKESETVKIPATTSDADGENVVVMYSGWMTSEEYKTSYFDSGSHTVVVSASDGKDTVSKEVKVVVENVNRKPVLEVTSEVKITEGNLAKITASATDEDNEAVVISYTTPFNSAGEWQTQIGDVGTYNIIVSADDGSDRVSKTVQVIVDPINHAPVFEKMSDITVYETETVVLNPKATDADFDSLTYSYSGWMNSETKSTTYGDAGEYSVKVTVSDSKTSLSQDIKVTVLHKNRPPTFG